MPINERRNSYRGQEFEIHHPLEPNICRNLLRRWVKFKQHFKLHLNDESKWLWRVHFLQIFNIDEYYIKFLDSLHMTLCASFSLKNISSKSSFYIRAYITICNMKSPVSFRGWRLKIVKKCYSAEKLFMLIELLYVNSATNLSRTRLYYIKYFHVYYIKGIFYKIELWLEISASMS